MPSGQHSHTAVAPLVPSGQHSSHTAVAPLASSDQHPSHEHTAVTLRESLPTQESSGQAPYTHQDGVGALPGRNSEVGVAVLPDESSSLGGATAATSSAIGTHANATSTVSRPGDGASNGSLLGGKGEQHDRVVDTQKTPSKVSVHFDLGRGEGYGDPKQTSGERRDTQLNPPQINLQARKHPLGTPGATFHGVGVGTASGYMREEGQRGHDETPAEVRCSVLSFPALGISRRHHGMLTDLQGTTHDTGYHPAELHPMPAEMSAESQGQRTVEAKKDETKQEDAGADDHAEGAKRVRKASFIEKMKGEAKVMIGKLEGKPEKVEEGKRMKAGEA